MPGPPDVEKLTDPARKLLEEIQEKRHDAIKRLWEKYQDGGLKIAPPQPAQANLELIPGNCLSVHTVHDEKTGSPADIQVSNLAAPDGKGINFMAYGSKARCLAFKGEARLLDAFLDFAHGVIGDERVESVMKTPSSVFVPHIGLEPGLCYDGFAARVEIVEYVMWLKGIDDSPKKYTEDIITMISCSRDGVSVALPSEEQDAQHGQEGDGPFVPVATPASWLHDMPEIGDEVPSSAHKDQSNHDSTARCEEMESSVDWVASSGVDNGPDHDVSLVPAPHGPEDHNSYIESDAAMAAALAKMSTRYSLRARSRPEEAMNGSPDKRAAPKPSPQKTSPKRGPYRKREVAQRVGARTRRRTGDCVG